MPQADSRRYTRAYITAAYHSRSLADGPPFDAARQMVESACYGSCDSTRAVMQDPLMFGGAGSRAATILAAKFLVDHGGNALVCTPVQMARFLKETPNAHGVCFAVLLADDPNHPSPLSYADREMVENHLLECLDNGMGFILEADGWGGYWSDKFRGTVDGFISYLEVASDAPNRTRLLLEARQEQEKAPVIVPRVASYRVTPTRGAGK